MTDAYATYDDVNERLNQIVDAVNAEDVTLDQALSLYEEAVKLGLRACDLSEENPDALEADEESSQAAAVGEENSDAASGESENDSDTAVDGEEAAEESEVEEG